MKARKYFILEYMQMRMCGCLFDTTVLVVFPKGKLVLGGEGGLVLGNVAHRLPSGEHVAHQLPSVPTTMANGQRLWEL